jgi:hypothetical protein
LRGTKDDPTGCISFPFVKLSDKGYSESLAAVFGTYKQTFNGNPSHHNNAGKKTQLEQLKMGKLWTIFPLTTIANQLI